MSENTIPRPTPQQKKRKSEASAAQTLTVIGSGMEIVGSLESTGLVRVAGKVLGNVNAAGQVMVARGGHVDGDVHAREAVLDGEITGSIVAERVEVQASAVIHGDITASRLIIHEGAVLNVEVVPCAPRAKRGAA
ncbi:MAG: polymer-forming cytoskeletal protein [Gemmatimonadetes bacterium]|nr:polymer-forming cytoskeletal protein [Gemmatimonadota bacterium]